MSDELSYTIPMSGKIYWHSLALLFYYTVPWLFNVSCHHTYGYIGDRPKPGKQSHTLFFLKTIMDLLGARNSSQLCK